MRIIIILLTRFGKRFVGIFVTKPAFWQGFRSLAGGAWHTHGRRQKGALGRLKERGRGRGTGAG
ncbi:hypothetical protein BX592_12959 [Paraburkholderia rhizosphaerae]|uniref:Uncharacterized protein n=1 Tax=Paraburkholderia rhizosphaerae TaxID=480658 RepID=A0A4R8L851_9BURK|nr:hypothetical protein BX592_12959 [Paraburkholderia rhizosphaerae]